MVGLGSLSGGRGISSGWCLIVHLLIRHCFLPSVLHVTRSDTLKMRRIFDRHRRAEISTVSDHPGKAKNPSDGLDVGWFR